MEQYSFIKEASSIDFSKIDDIKDLGKIRECDFLCVKDLDSKKLDRDYTDIDGLDKVDYDTFTKISGDKVPDYTIYDDVKIPEI